MGRLLAASHYAADIGIAHTIGSYPQERLTREDVDGVRFRTLAATQFAFFNQVNAELVDLDYEGLPELRRYRMILLPVPTGSMYKDGKVPEYMRLSNRAQRLLAAYVQEGGIVVAYPEPPKGADLQPLFPPWNGTEPNEGVRAAPLSIGNASGYQNKFGKGSAIVLQSEFDRWVPLRSVTSSPESPLPNQPVLSVLEKRAAGRILEGLLDTAGIKRGALSPGLEKGLALQQPYLSLLVANAPAESGKGHSFGFLSITNFATGPYRFQVLVRDPRTGENLTLPPLEVGGRDALLLPLRVGLKELGFTGADGQKTNDEIYYSTAELTSVRSESGALLIDLYSKGKASLRLRLNREPTGAPTAGGEILERRYYPATRILDVDIPAPKDSTGRQTLRIPYELLKGPHAPSEETGQPRVDIRPTPRIPVRFDVAYDLLPATRFATIGETVEFSFTHPFDCTNKCKARVSADDLVVSQVDPEKTPSFTVRVPLERTYVRKLEWTLENNGKTYKGEGRIVFYPPGSAVAVECDVDRDGFTDYILENEKLRLILFPHAGARSFALVRKDTNSSAFTSIGGLRDLFRVQMPDPPKHDRLPAWTRRGLPGMHNRFYEGRIVQEEQHRLLQLGRDLAEDVHHRRSGAGRRSQRGASGTERPAGRKCRLLRRHVQDNPERYRVRPGIHKPELGSSGIHGRGDGHGPEERRVRRSRIEEANPGKHSGRHLGCSGQARFQRIVRYELGARHIRKGRLRPARFQPSASAAISAVEAWREVSHLSGSILLRTGLSPGIRVPPFAQSKELRRFPL